MSGEGTVRIEHRRFGSLEVPERDVLAFEPLPGFPGARRFALMAHDREGVFAWLVSLDHPDLAFVITDPRTLRPDYAPQLPAHDVQSLGAAAPEDWLRGCSWLGVGVSASTPSLGWPLPE